MIARQGPSVADCLAAAMWRDPSLTVREAVSMVPVAWATVEGTPYDEREQP